MDRTLLEIVRQRLDQGGDAKAPWAKLVLAACSSDDALAAALDDAEWKPQAKGTGEVVSSPAYIRSVMVEGFRGIGAASTLELAPGNGLTLVVGRNGSGKSSFAEAVELLTTGTNRRWSTRSKVWRDGWRNLHHGSAEIRVEFVFEGDGIATAIQQWPAEGELETATRTIQRGGGKKTTFESLGWTRSLELYRPFLSYNELGAMFDEGPTALFDKLSAMLGLEDLSAAQKALQKERLDAGRAKDAVRSKTAGLVTQLHLLDDDRARKAREELESATPDLTALRKLLVTAEPSDETMGAAMRQLVALDSIDVDAVARAADALRKAVAAEDALTGTPAAEARELAQLLGAALDYHEQHKPKKCPVCSSGDLGKPWRDATAKRVTELEARAARFDETQRSSRAALSRLTSFLRPVPACVTSLRKSAVDTTKLATAWNAWLSADDADVKAAAARIENQAKQIAALLTTAQEQARAAVATRDDAWARVVPALASWVDEATSAAAASGRVTDIARAEEWLRDTSDDIRRERFAPVADHARRLWDLMRQQSNVELEALTLEGSGARRRSELRVEVDGKPAQALGVMSQGELHAIALSLFVPRATTAESPFRFMVIDDPVQSMDPARVDGLARVLELVAADRQVIVFTHDDRLAEAVRRLEIRATTLGVTRREGSVVQVRTESDPVTRAIADARTLAFTDELPLEIARRTVPGFCRLAIEAACWEVVRRRRLLRGDSFVKVEESIAEAKTLTQLVSLALYDDKARGVDVLPRINRDFGPEQGDAFKASNSGPHEGYAGDLKALTQRTSTLTAHLRKLK
ncbi:MAG TPA: AAA family ATPase [Candidatus Limnocylindrales bacterium]|nr:AAA family ATPase [Candidatus Limnocylindrales bacterium]